jgi:hypothetical protein
MHKKKETAKSGTIVARDTRNILKGLTVNALPSSEKTLITK